MTAIEYLQSVIDSPEAKPYGFRRLSAELPAPPLNVSVISVAPTPPPPPPPPPPVPPAPIINRIMQDKNAWAHPIALGDTAAHSFANETISDGGYINHLGTGPLTVTNCQNEKGNQAGGGHYWIMLWPSPLHGEPQAAVSQCIVHAEGCTIYQGASEAAIRGKCDDFQMYGGTVVAHLQPNGNQVKPIVEIRHGKSWLFKGVTFKDGWPEIGEQQTAQPDGSAKLETSQHVGTVTFDGCRFTRFNGTIPFSRKPGVDRIICVNCVGQDGKTFSKTY